RNLRMRSSYLNRRDSSADYADAKIGPRIFTLCSEWNSDGSRQTTLFKKRLCLLRRQSLLFLIVLLTSLEAAHAASRRHLRSFLLLLRHFRNQRFGRQQQSCD